MPMEDAFLWGWLAGVGTSVIATFVGVGLWYLCSTWCTETEATYETVGEEFRPLDPFHDVEMIADEIPTPHTGNANANGGIHDGFVEDAWIDPAKFQEYWNEMGRTGIITAQFKMEDDGSLPNVEELLGACNINCIASGTVDDQEKSYFYAEQSDGGMKVLVEVVLYLDQQEMTVKLKCEASDMSDQFLEVLRGAFGSVIVCEV
eukprot:TRINITY_DN17576_c0_g1_i1.p1 TRINITY_DN17576_c0_g1~~TRINITY_DN17576_c0_g1_i1.p1  ORF type:complete len:204 (+),score=30.74 TRINITY_DN17576_c0_g1_i1:239-850(+)